MACGKGAAMTSFAGIERGRLNAMLDAHAPCSRPPPSPTLRTSPLSLPSQPLRARPTRSQRVSRPFNVFDASPTLRTRRSPFRRAVSLSDALPSHSTRCLPIRRVSWSLAAPPDLYTRRQMSRRAARPHASPALLTRCPLFTRYSPTGRVFPFERIVCSIDTSESMFLLFSYVVFALSVLFFLFSVCHDLRVPKGCSCRLVLGLRIIGAFMDTYIPCVIDICTTASTSSINVRSGVGLTTVRVEAAGPPVHFWLTVCW